MSFALSQSLDPNKVFFTRKSELTKRWDVPYFVPSIVALEKKVQKITPHRLRDFVLRMSGGSTPLTTESETHYTESSDGVPFIRVQNLSTTGQLNLEDCKRVTRSTHQTLLERSRLGGGELLVKITGVGRMAVASVVPEKFEANINQHIAAIWTDSIKTSEALASYLNLDFVERLASRRSTGGTRPALDYPALLSLPIIMDERVPKLVNAAIQRSNEQLSKASSLLAEIDGILLKELGITPKPLPPNTIKSRIFRRPFSTVVGSRFDAPANWTELTLKSKIYPCRKLTDLVSINPTTCFDTITNSQPVTFVPMEAVSETFGEISENYSRPLSESGSYTTFREGDLIWAKITPCMENGKSAVAEKLVNGFGFGSTEFHVFRPTNSNLKIHYLHALFRMAIVREHARLFFGGSSGHQRVDEEFFNRLEIPLPPVEVQEEIVAEIEKVRTAAQALRRQAAAELAAAKKSIEAMILGEAAAK